jgi:hypothetical protein
MQLFTISSVRRYLAVPLLVLSACAVEPGGPTDNPYADPGADEVSPAIATAPVYAPPRQGMEVQCPWLLGEEIDAYPGASGHHFSVSVNATTLAGSPRTVQLSGGAELRLTGSNVVADDLVFDGVAGGQVRIDVSRSYPGLTYYRLWYRATATSTWTQQCGGDEAVPLSGSFTTTGLHEATAGQISFACAVSGGFKCTDWGYQAGTNASSDEWDIHQACTRMTRADYCADGTSHTEEGTHIKNFDEVGINPEPPMSFYGLDQWPPPPHRFQFEAGWRGGDLPPVCLSKLRWSNMPIGGYCAGVLPDPRVDVSAKDCDTLATSPEQLALLYDTKLFNSSLWNTLTTHVWRSGSDLVSSVDGYYSDPSVTPPLAPYRSAGTYTWLASDATLLRSLPDSIQIADVVDVDLYTDGTSDLVYLPVTAAGLVPPNYRSIGWRGMAYNAPRDGTAPLVLYRNNTTGDHITTTLPPVNGYTALGTVAHVSVVAAP